MSKSKAIADVIRAHVDACCAEIRAEVEREFAQAIAALAARAARRGGRSMRT